MKTIKHIAQGAIVVAVRPYGSGTPEFDAACDRYFAEDASNEVGGSVFAEPKEVAGKGTGTAPRRP